MTMTAIATRFIGLGIDAISREVHA